MVDRIMTIFQLKFVRVVQDIDNLVLAARFYA